MLYMVTFTIHIPQMLLYIPYGDPVGIESNLSVSCLEPFCDTAGQLR